MKKRVFFITLFAVVALHAATLYSEQTQTAPKSSPMLKSNIPETIICPATLSVNIGTNTVNPSGWPGKLPNVLDNRAYLVVPFKLTEIKGDYLLCWYQDNAFCSAVLIQGGHLGICEFYIWQEKPGYFCEKAPSNNGFVCRPK